MKKKKIDITDKKPFNLDQLPKENIFQVPDRYFDELPGLIQAKVSGNTGVSWWQAYLTPANGWKVALASAVIALVLVFGGVFDRSTVNYSVDDLLADVSLEDLIEYVEYSDISTDEILAELDLSDYEVDFLMGNEIQLIDDSEYDNLDASDLYEEYGIDDDIF